MPAHQLTVAPSSRAMPGILFRLAALPATYVVADEVLVVDALGTPHLFDARTGALTAVQQD